MKPRLKKTTNKTNRVEGFRLSEPEETVKGMYKNVPVVVLIPKLKTNLDLTKALTLCVECGILRGRYISNTLKGR